MNTKWKISALIVVLLLIIGGVWYFVQSKDEEVTDEPVTEQEDQHPEEELNKTSDDEIDIEETLVELPPLDEFEPTSVEPGSHGKYDITYKLDQDGWFTVSSSIEVTNLSNENWENIGFYLVPNAMTEEHLPDPGEPLQLEIGDVTVNGAEAEWTLEDNNFFVELTKELQPNETTTVSISYKMDVNDGVRLRQDGNSYYLVYSYPMLGTYQDGWNIEFFNPNGESYHTSFGEFTVHYELPEEYYVVTSAVDGEAAPTTSGTVTGDNIKDFYIGFLHASDWVTDSIETDSAVTLRSFVPKTDEEILDKTLQYLLDAFTFLEQNIGDYMSVELDMIANNGGMEYPYVIEVYDSTVPDEDLENVIAHEAGHQWFYHMIGNDPYKEPWLDEGLTEFVVTLYLYDKYNDKELATFRPKMFTAGAGRVAVNQQIDEFNMINYGVGAYGMPAFKLWEYFESKGTIEDALDFLAAYYDRYLQAQVTTEEFVHFFEVYHGEHDHDFFNEWMDLDWESVH